MLTTRLLLAASLALTAGFAAAATAPSAKSPSAVYVDGSDYQLSLTPFVSTRTRAEVAAEARAVNRVPAYVDGSEYEQMMAMFMSQKTREMIRGEAVLANRNAQRDHPEAFGGRN